MLRESGPGLGNFLGAFILSFAVVAVLALGIAAAYGTVMAILFAMAPRSQRPRTPFLVPSQSQASGD